MNGLDDAITSALRADAAHAPEPPLEWRPSAVRHTRGHVERRPVRLLAGAAVVVLCFAGVGVAVTRGATGDRVSPALPSATDPGESALPGSAATFPPAGTTPENFLIVGTDANACIEPDSAWAGAADPANVGMRTDTLMVIRLDPAARSAAVLSFPRDLWVDIAGRGQNRINSAYVPGDSSLLSQTIYDNFGIVVDHNIQVDYCAFKRIVDAVGGVAVPFATPVRDRYVGLNITSPGCHAFSGDEALAYVRSRHLEWVDDDGVAHPDPTADLGRIQRQQDFLRRLLTKAAQTGLFNPDMARALIESRQNDIVTEVGFTLDDMLRVAGILNDIDPATIQQYRVEATPILETGNAVLEPVTDTPTMAAVLSIFRGEAPTAGAVAGASDSTTANTQPATSQEPPIGAIAPTPGVDC